MNQFKFNWKWGVGIGSVFLLLLALDSWGTAKLYSARTANQGGLPSDEGAPATREAVIAAYRRGGWGTLSTDQQLWARRLYVNDLGGLLEHVNRRRISYESRGLQKHVIETTVASQLLRDAITLARDPTQDPTTTQPLIDEVNAALKR